MNTSQQQSPYKSKRGIKRIKNATIYSLKGLQTAVRYEAAFHTELLLCLVLMPFAFVLGQNGFEILFLLFTLFLVLITELLNSAVEAVADRISHDYDEYIERAKDMGSAAVFLCFTFIAITWGYFLIKRFFL